MVVVRNTSDKVAEGVTVRLKWEGTPSYETKQDEPYVIPPRGRAVFLLSTFDVPQDVKGEPKAEAQVDKLGTGSHPEVSFDGFKLSGCELTGTASNEDDKAHLGINGLVAGLKDGKIVTAGSIFFEEPGLQPGKETKFRATLEPLCPKGAVDEWVAFANLPPKDTQHP